MGTRPALTGHATSVTSKLTADQLSASDYLGCDACIVAGPGSGKTTVLVERYRRLVLEREFEPRQILAITFTEKAAANMKAKLAEQFASEPERLRELESTAWVSTIHGFCARLLRENAIAAGLDPRFTVLSPREAENLQYECLHAALDKLTEIRREEVLALIDALHVPSLIGDLHDVYDAIRSAGKSINEVRAMANPAPAAEPLDITGELRTILRSWPFGVTPIQAAEKSRLLDWCDEFDATGAMDFPTFLELKNRLKLNLNKVHRPSKDAISDLRDAIERHAAIAVDEYAAPFRALIFDALGRFDDEYRNRKAAQGRVDFNDLERHAIALLANNPAVQQRVHKQFRQIMLDEFQDINGQQAELIELLRSANVFFGVGDRNQSIYGFRHARPEIFQDYANDVAFRSGQSGSLLDNFRSRQVILNCVAEVLGGEAGIDERPLVAGRDFAGKDEASIEVIAVTGDPEGEEKDVLSEREAKWIAHRVSELHGALQLGEPGETHSADFRDFAVLCRAGDSMSPILNAFDRAGIPYVCGRRQSFLVSREGLDIAALLRVIANPMDSISLATLLRGPFVGISDEGMLRLRLLAGTFTGGLNKFAHHPDAANIPEPDASRLTAFCASLERWRSDLAVVPLDILLARALVEYGVDWIPMSASGANIESFLQLARSTGATMDLSAFLREIEDLADAAGTDSELSDEDQGNCVQVMTAHAAKGLEFPVTIIAGMEKGSRHESRAVTFTPEHGLGMKWRNPTGKDNDKGLKDSWAESNRETLAVREREEENRLLYVAMTRAEEHLILTYVSGKKSAQNWAKLIDRRLNVQSVDADPPTRAHAAIDPLRGQIERVAKPVIEDQYETTATVTSLAVFGSCPRKYYIQRSLGWNTGRFRRFDPDETDAADNDDEEPNLSASRVGSAVHQILAGQTPIDDVPEARNLAEVFTASDRGKRSASAPRAAREWAFIADIDGTIVRGSIDLWFEDNGELHIVDYKTDDVTAASAREKAQEYAPQTALYAIALERAQGKGKRPKSAWLHFLRPNTIVEIPLNDTAISHARKLVADLRQAQNELRFDLNEGDHCRACQFYRTLCPAGRSDAILEVTREPDHYIAGN